METKPFKTAKEKFCRKFNFNNYPKKSQIYLCVHKFQATGLVNNLNLKAENPRSGRMLTARCPDNKDTVRESLGRSPKKSLLKTFPKSWSFMCIITENLKEGSSTVAIQNLDNSSNACACADLYDYF